MDLKTYLRQKNGSVQLIADAFGVTTQAVYGWCKLRIPAERVLGIFQITDGAVTPSEMRPDIYPNDEVIKAMLEADLKADSSDV